MNKKSLDLVLPFNTWGLHTSLAQLIMNTLLTYSSKISSIQRTLRAELWADLLMPHSLRSRFTPLDSTVYTMLFTATYIHTPC